MLYIFLMINYLLLVKSFPTITKMVSRIKTTLSIYNGEKEVFEKIKRSVLLSKLIYDYDFVKEHDISTREQYYINTTQNVSFTNITVDFVKRNNIFFNLKQFVGRVNKDDFLKNTDKYFNLLNEHYQQTEIYGYFYNKKRLHSLLLINHLDKEIVVVFRGSQYIEEWVKNINFKEKTIPFCDKYKMHGGILNMYTQEKVDNNMVYILDNLYYYFPEYTKIFTGHSKGSVNCVLLACELLDLLKEKYNYEIFLFGNPPVYNLPFGIYLNNNPNLKIYNVLNDNDIVTTLPFLGKYQVGTEVLLKNKSIIVIDHEYPYKKQLDIRRFYNSVGRHNLNNYIKKIYDL